MNDFELSRVIGFEFSNDGKKVATFGMENRIEIYDTVKGELMRELKVENTSVNSLKYSVDNK